MHQATIPRHELPIRTLINRRNPRNRGDISSQHICCMRYPNQCECDKQIGKQVSTLGGLSCLDANVNVNVNAAGGSIYVPIGVNPTANAIKQIRTLTFPRNVDHKTVPHATNAFTVACHTPRIWNFSLTVKMPVSKWVWHGLESLS